MGVNMNVFVYEHTMYIHSCMYVCMYICVFGERERETDKAREIEREREEEERRKDLYVKVVKTHPALFRKFRLLNDSSDGWTNEAG